MSFKFHRPFGKLCFDFVAWWWNNRVVGCPTLSLKVHAGLVLDRKQQLFTRREDRQQTGIITLNLGMYQTLMVQTGFHRRLQWTVFISLAHTSCANWKYNGDNYWPVVSYIKSKLGTFLLNARCDNSRQHFMHNPFSGPGLFWSAFGYLCHSSLIKE